MDRSALEVAFSNKLAALLQSLSQSPSVVELPPRLPPKLIVGCSGGADSFSLTLLCQKWLQVHGGSLLVAVVDHGLRRESAFEAKQTVHWLTQRHIPSRLMSITETPSGNLQAFARTQRLNLLCQYAREVHADAVLLAHHRRDQAETVLDHLARGSHVLGLSGILPTSQYQDVTLLRPLLDHTPGALRAYASQAGAPIIDDPSNQNPRFRRVQLRHWLQQNPNLEHRAIRLAERARYHASIELAACRALWRQSVRSPLLGILYLDRSHWPDYPACVQQRTLGSMICYITGCPYPPRRAQLRRACIWMQAPQRQQITLGGTRLAVVGNDVWLYGEDRPAPQTLAPGTTQKWGAVWQISHGYPHPVMIRPLGRRGWRKAFPHHASCDFLGETYPSAILPDQPEHVLSPSNSDKIYFDFTPPQPPGTDLSKSGLYFTSLYPIS